MTSPECQVRLHRDALSTPWGFRLQGGKDFKVPLTVQRVFVGSPADGEIHRGDVILSIDNYDATQMVHKQAMDVIKQAGGAIIFRLRRSYGARPTTAPVAAPVSRPAALPVASQYRSRNLDSVGSPVRNPTMSGFVGYGQDYRAPPQAYKQVPDPMLNRVQHSLNQAVWSPGQENDEVDYEPTKCVNDLKRVFADPPRQEEKRTPVKELKRQYNFLSKQSTKPAPKPVHHQQQPRPYNYNAKPAWQKPQPGSNMLKAPCGLTDPGWSPSSQGWNQSKAPQASRYHPISHTPTHAGAPPPPRPINARPPAMEPVHIEPARPAWMGSLKSSGGPKPWEMREAEAIGGPGTAEHHSPAAASHHPPPQQQQGQPPSHHQPQPQQQNSPHVPVHQPRVQNVHYGPGASTPEYQQHDPSAHQNSDSAQIKHLQYNSPLGLYSKSNVNAALHGQTSGKPGQGTMQVTGGGANKPFNPSTSDVYKLLLEEETRSKGQGQQPQSARYENPSNQGEMQYQGYMDHNKQSPAIQRLEARIADGSVGMGDHGTSDF